MKRSRPPIAHKGKTPASASIQTTGGQRWQAFARQYFAVLSVLAVVGLLLLATGLRFYRIEVQSYWNDEGNSRVLASRDVPTILRNAAADVHPPGYYLLLKFWRDATGETEFALRGLSALQGIVLVAVLFRLGKEWFGFWAGLIAALFGAANPFLVYYAQEARMYSQLALCSAASFWLLGRLEKQRENWALVIGYVLVTALGLYTHYAFGFVGLAQGLIVVAKWLAQLRHTSHVSRFTLSSLLPPLACLLLFAPWLPTAYRHLTSWPAAREGRPLTEALAELARYLAYGRTIETASTVTGLIAVGAVILFAFAQHGVAPGMLKALVWLLLPAGLTLGLGLLTEAFAKFLLVAVPPLCVLFAAAGAAAWPAQRRTLFLSVAGLGFLAAIAWTSVTSLQNLYFDSRYYRDDYRGIAQHLQRLQREGDAVITNSPNQVEAFAYYYRDEARLFPLPDSRPLDKARTQSQLEAIAAAHQRVFVLYWGDTQADPEKFIEDWLNTHTFKAGEQWFGQVRLATYAVAQPASTPATITEAHFGDHIALEGYTLSASAFAPGDIAQLTFFWRTGATLTERYKVFLHLYAAVDAPPVAQTDSEPGGGLGLTTIWQPGQRVADNHGLLIPLDLPPGEYRLMAGLYNLNDGVRLPLTVDDTIVGDRFDLGLITVMTKDE
jgi:hypothetical protein